jgi:nucleoside-diphosphate-sugar epimerase
VTVRHLAPEGAPVPRTVIVGAGGFVGGALAAALKATGVETVPLGRADVDLDAPEATDRLKRILHPGDAVAIVAAKAPCKTPRMLVENVAMMAAVLDALTAVKPSYALYVSSDAVYADSDGPLTEHSPKAPESLHGVMHLARETMLLAALADVPVGIVRPTLIYGAADPHNGYGPNRFARLAAKGEPIVLFGAGEERRDHVSICDVAELARRMIARRTVGALNAATGTVLSFRQAAEIAVARSGRTVEIRDTPRQGAMPHRGYRPFDAAGVIAAFPDFEFTDPVEGIGAMAADAARG